MLGIFNTIIIFDAFWKTYFLVSFKKDGTYVGKLTYK